MNPYKTLGVDEDADDEEVKKAYRKKAKEHHPDQGGDEEKFKEVQEAYDEITSEGGTGGIGGGFDRQDPFASRGAASGFDFGGKNKTTEEFVEDFYEFASQGGFDRRGFHGTPFEDATQEIYDVDINFATAVLGGRVTVHVPEETGPVTIEIPPGIQDGDKLGIYPEGNRRREIKIQVNVVNNSVYWRQNENDIYTEYQLPVWDAMTGTEISIDPITDEKTIKLELDPGVQDGQLFRIKGEGGPQTHGGKPQGDMYVRVSIKIPAITDEEKVEIINQIKHE